MPRNPPITLDDDDIVFRINPETGERRAWIERGTAGNDHLIWTGRTNGVIIVGGTGADWIERTPFSGTMEAYGDNPSGPSEPSFGPRFSGGDDRIDFGWGDKVKSGEGEDTYRGVHGDRHGRAPAKLWINVEDDVVVAPADRVVVKNFDIKGLVDGPGNRWSAELDTLRLEFDTSDAFADPIMVFMLGEDRRGEDRPDIILNWRGNGENGAQHLIDEVVDFVKAGGDNVAHDWWEAG